MTTPRTALILAGSIAVSCLAQLASAQTTVAHWRFENSGSLGTDSSGNNHTLTLHHGGTGGTPISSVATPFPNPVPGTGSTNNFAASLVTANRNYLSMADSAALNFQSFTYEGYFKVDSLSGANPAILGGQWDSTTANGAGMNWQLVVLSTNQVRLQLGTAASGGTAFSNVDSGINLTLGHNYYIGVSAAASGTVAGTDVVFYIQDLTLGTAMQSVSVTSAAVRNLNSAVTGNFAIGTNYNGVTAYDLRTFTGTIDEIRLTNGVLDQSQLLAIPEPAAAAALLGLGALGFCAFRRRR